MNKFSEKLEYLAKSNSFLSKEVSENYSDWNENKISYRQKGLAKDAKAIWRIQELT